MKNAAKSPSTFHSISELHRALGLPKPFHPLISLVNYGAISVAPEDLPTALILNFYKISYKLNLQGKIKYGQNYYDFDEGGLSFISPNQIIAASEDEKDYSGYTLLFHADFIRNHALGKNIRNFGFFSYSTNEALHLSESEKTIIIGIFENITKEFSVSIDSFSQDLIASQIELLLKYSDRFYNRQFITRKIGNNNLLSNLEQLLSDYFADEKPLTSGLPTVQYLSDALQVSPRYLSDMLRSLTGQNAQQHIHSKVIEKAKDYLSTGNLSVSEIAYQLGFEHPQSFSKIFKRKTSLTPIEFKQSFN